MLQVVIRTRQQTWQAEHEQGLLELGRFPAGDVSRIVLDDPHVSRRQCRLEQVDERLRIENLSQHVAIHPFDSAPISPGESIELPLPVSLRMGSTQVDVNLVDNSQRTWVDEWQTVQLPQRVAGARASDEFRSGLVELDDAPSVERLTHWFERLVAVQRSAAGSDQFYLDTAGALVDLVGLDLGLVLRRVEGDQWQVLARHPDVQSQQVQFSRTLLKRLVTERRTFFGYLDTASLVQSMLGIEAIVASPLFDRQGGVTGALYGVRLAGRGPAKPEIRPLEAQMVQLLAAAVDSGLARLDREAEAARARIQFEQFFSTTLARELERDPQLLAGADREVTVLFADVCGFSRLSEQLGPADTCRLIGDCMELFTAVVTAHQGVLVDYIGDGLLAMWNAPQDDAEHADRACRAAIELIDALPQINADWESHIGRPIDVGIGVNTGLARVGNIGSRRRFKYGPLGHSVNLASRVQGVARQLGLRIAITGHTRALLRKPYCERRIGPVRVAGLDAPIELFEIEKGDTGQLPVRFRLYEEAWRQLASGDAAGCLSQLASGLGSASCVDDIPLQRLVDLAQRLRAASVPPFEPVLICDQK